jgi:glycosyltransferase involved in cell wall biosynthesis
MTSDSDRNGTLQQSTRTFAVVIPVYNHGGTVASVIREVLLQKLPVIVVDDGSTDDTYENIRSIPGIRVLRHPRNRGKGAALVTGMREAAKIARWAVCLDADGQHDPDDTGALLAAVPATGSAILIGKREGMETAPWTSRFGRNFSNFWVWISGAPLLSDSQSGFRIYPLPEILHLDIKAGRYQYELEVLAKAAWHDIPIIEIPVRVSYTPFGPRISHFHPWADFLRNTKTFSRLITHRVFSPRLWPGVRKKPPAGTLFYYRQGTK